jgi:hypothetical protein
MKKPIRAIKMLILPGCLILMKKSPSSFIDGGQGFDGRITEMRATRHRLEKKKG